MQCYEQFGWVPQDIFDLPDHEAQLLSIYFEEVMRHQTIKQREMDNNHESRPNSEGWYTEYEIGNDPDEDEDV